MSISTAAKTSATVETLTAEVRTLVVGTRQITLSVANQLDIIPLRDLTVMGRVHLRGDADYVIGSDPDGVLSLARYDPKPPFIPPFVDADDLPAGRKVTICPKSLSFSAASEVDLRFGPNPKTMSFRLARKATIDCGKHQIYIGQDRCNGWSADDETMEQLRDVVRDRWWTEVRRVALNKVTAEAPLIVLAGLR